MSLYSFRGNSPDACVNRQACSPFQNIFIIFWNETDQASNTMPRRFLFVLFGLFFFVQAGSLSDQYVDSLKQQLEILKEETTRAQTLNALTEHFAGRDATLAWAYAEKSLAIRKKIDFKVGMADSYAALGQIKVKQGRPLEGLPLLEKALKISRLAGAKYKISNRLAEWANCMEQLGRYPQAYAYQGAQNISRQPIQ